MLIVGISGSLREDSYNTALLRAAADVAPDDVTIEIASIADIPLYDGDRERQDGVPMPVVRLKNRIASADGLLLATPEYNNSVPGVLKNALDWLSRPPKDIERVFGGRRVGIIGATPGRGGTRLGQLALLPVLRTLGTDPWFGKALYVAGASETYDGNGALVDEDTRKHLTEYVEGFAAAVREDAD